MATLLIVDDDTLIRETLREFLSSSHECHTADRAEQALAFLEIESYDVVLTDISMPGLSGRDLMRHIQVTHETTPVIVISSIHDGNDAQQLIDMGAFAVFIKPFQLEEVDACVDRAVARHQELARAEQEAASPEDALPKEPSLTSEPTPTETDPTN